MTHMKLTKSLIFAAIVSSFITSCESDGTSSQSVLPTPRKEIQLTRSQEETLQAQIAFSFDYLKGADDVATKNGVGNFIVSPYSMSRVLSILANGATGPTLDKLLKTLHFPNGSATELNALNATLYNAIINCDGLLSINMANSVWYGKNFSILPSFSEITATQYNAQSSQVDFGNHATINTINDWISSNTGGIIENFFSTSDLNQNTMFVLLDALYFKGKWKNKFNTQDTKQMQFFNHGDSPAWVNTMNNTLYTEVGGDETVSLLKLPYGNEAISLYIIMPDEGNGLDEVIQNMDTNKWSSLKGLLTGKTLKVSFPKFKIEDNLDASEILTSLGLPLGNPELKNMTDMYESVHVLDIKQKVSLTIDEEGTEAVTASSVSGMITSPGIEGHIHINRPFLFIIEEFSTNTILFMGKITEL